MSSSSIKAALLILAAFLIGAFLSGCRSQTTPPAAPPPSLDQTRVGLALVAAGLTTPVALATPDDASGRLFIVDQPGRIFILNANGNLLPNPFLDLASRLVPLVIDATDERGLLCLVFHPQYAQNGRFFVVYNAPVRPTDPPGFDDIWRLSEFHVSANDPDRADDASEVVLLEILKPQGNHNGGQLAFGPDGMLYAGIGDGGQASDVGPNHTPGLGNAQDLTNLLGSLLRLNADRPGVLAVPPDNPFTANPAVLPQIFAYGLRNPWRFSFDTAGSRRLFCADVGQSLFEEVDIVHSGDNLGWNIKEGRHCFDPTHAANPPPTCPNAGADARPLIDPIIEYGHRNAEDQQAYLAAIGGYVYRGSDVPDLAGRYVFGDWSRLPDVADGTLFVAEEDAAGNWQFNELPIAVATSANARINRYVLAFGQDLRGELYILTTQNAAPTGVTGQVFKIVRAQ